MGSRVTFTRMWRLIQNNYQSTMFGKYRDIFTPQLMAAIFFEESRFANITENQGGPAVGFGQVNRPEIPAINQFWGTSFDANGADVLKDDAQSVQLAGLCLAMLFEKQSAKMSDDNRRAVALKNYAGYPRNQDIPPNWLASEKALKGIPFSGHLHLPMDPAKETQLKAALNLALKPWQRNGYFEFFPTFLSPLGKWKVDVGDWHWIYSFNDDSTIDYRKIDKPKDPKGTGQWSVDHNRLRIVWDGTRSIEEWRLPLRQEGQSGELLGQGRIIRAHQFKA
jgi:hypothetical protein